jgi:hypothetical protein
MDKVTQILENVVRCKYFEAGVHIKNPIKNSYQDGLGRTTQTLDHVVGSIYQFETKESLKLTNIVILAEIRMACQQIDHMIYYLMDRKLQLGLQQGLFIMVCTHCCLQNYNCRHPIIG